jgi:hypothetical protein
VKILTTKMMALMVEPLEDDYLRKECYQRCTKKKQVVLCSESSQVPVLVTADFFLLASRRPDKRIVCFSTHL